MSKGSCSSSGTAQHLPRLSRALLWGHHVPPCTKLCLASSEQGDGTGSGQGNATSTHARLQDFGASLHRPF